MAAARPRYFCLAGALAFTAALAAGSLLVGSGQAQSTDGHTWTYRWTEPPDGAPVAWYQVQLVTNGRDTTVIDRVAGTTVHIAVVLGNDYKIRVRGYTAAGVPGRYSDWSLMETFEQDPPTNESGTAGG